MIDTQTVSVNFGQGIDTKTDSKLVVQGKLTRLENGVFTNSKRVSKRNGYDLITNAVYGGGTITTPYLVKSFKNELVCADGQNFYSYSPSLGKWVNKGHYESIAVSNTEVSGTTIFSAGAFKPQASQSSAISQSYAAYCWSQGDSAGNFAIYATIKDVISGTPVYAETQITSSVTATPCPKIVALSSGVFGVFYINSSLNLVVKVLTVTPSSVTLSSETNIATDFCRYYFDVAPASGGGCYLTYNASVAGTQNAAFKLLLIDSNGSVTRTASNAFSNGASPIYPTTVCVDPSNNQVWAIYTSGAATTMTIRFYCYDSALTTLVTSGGAGGTINTITRLGAAAASGTCYLFYNQQNTVAPTTYNNVASYQITNTGTATIGAFGTLATDLLTKPFFLNGSLYVGVIFYSAIPTQNTGFLFHVSSNTVVAKYLLKNAWTENAVGTPGAVTFPVNSVSSTQVSVALPFNIARESIGGVGSSAPLVGTTQITLDFNHQDSYQAVVVGRSLILNGASPKIYDGNSLTTFGFDVYPVITASQTTGGSMGLGVYTYYAVFQWVDGNGDVHQSEPSDPVTVTLTGSNNAVSLTYSGYQFSDRQYSTQVVLYRTPANAVGGYAITAFEYQGTYTGYTDTLADPITGNQGLYTNGGVVQNALCPPSMIMLVHNNRLWMIDSEQDSVAWYSKTLGPGIGVSMSDLFTYQADTYGGGITAAASMDDKLVLFKKTLPVYVFGDGANDSGSGSTLGQSQRVPSDTGCNSSKSVVVGPNGVVFKGDKGIYLLDRSLSMGYLGADVEAYNSQPITSAILLQSVNQMRFLTSSGLTLVYDYIMQQWSTFTNHTGYSADLFGGVYVYARTDGSIYKENSTSYLDGSTAYRLKAQTSWLKFASVQGLQRVRRVGFLGDIVGVSSHGVQISCAYDFSTTFSTPIQYFPTSAGAIQYRERLSQQKCDALQLLIEEVTSGASGEFIDFSDLSFEAGMKRGLNKLQSSQSVG